MAVTSHLGHFNWKDVDVTFVDAPGGLSFLEANRGVLPGVDGVVFLVSPLEPLKAEGVRLWKLLSEERIPTLVFFNKMDEPQADYLHCALNLQEQLNGRFLPITVPSLKSEKVAEVSLGQLLDQRSPGPPGRPVHFAQQLTGSHRGARRRFLLEEYLEGREPSAPYLRASKRPSSAGACFPFCAVRPNPDLDWRPCWIPSSTSCPTPPSA